jgi:hypothetical protein
MGSRLSRAGILSKSAAVAYTLNDQVFRGFFTGRYLFDSVTGFPIRVPGFIGRV